MRLLWTRSPSYFAAFAFLLILGTAQAQQQPGDQSPEDERIKSMTEEAKKKEAKNKLPFEIFRTQVAPFDILPFVKPNHWSTLSVELRANQADYAGSLQTTAVPLRDQPHSVVFRRDARLVKEQRSRLSMQVFLPQIPRELGMDLIRPDQIRPDESTIANLRVLESHQMLIMVLSRKANDSYAKWNNLHALVPSNGADDVNTMERMRYYRLVLPLEPDKPVLSPHPLTWSVISHVIWDGLEPELLSPAQQVAMLDWLHWGGQLILVGGAGPTFAPLRESFLAPYLPADLSGTNFQLTTDDLKPLSQAYPPLTKLPDPNDPQPEPLSPEDVRTARERYGRRYSAPIPIAPASNRPVFLTGLAPKPGAVAIPLGSGGDSSILGVEWRVGRGRVLMLGLNPTDPSFTAWPGLDTFVRRVVLRRPEELMKEITRRDGGHELPRYQSLGGEDLTWVRYLGRDLEAGATGPESKKPNSEPKAVNHDPDPRVPRRNLTQRGNGSIAQAADEAPPPSRPVGDWLDDAALPKVCLRILEEASGLSIPSSTFVFKVLFAYVLTLVPLNWLICRFVLGRKEWAWVIVPILSLAFAIGIERAASFDLGFDAACDEIDVLEIQGEYSRGHLSRFGSIYSSSRVQFAISYPDDSTALALPFNSLRSLRGEDVTESTFQTQPIPALRQFRVQPRSYSMFRAEQMLSLDGPIRLIQDREGRSIVNESELDLRDAMFLDGQAGVRVIGDIPKGATVKIGDEISETMGQTSAEGPLKPDELMRLVQNQKQALPEEQGALRLLAWSPGLREGQLIEPTLDRHRGFTLIVVDLKHGLPPSPAGPRYDAIVNRADPEPVPTMPSVNDGSTNPNGTQTRQIQIR